MNKTNKDGTRGRAFILPFHSLLGPEDDRKESDGGTYVDRKLSTEGHWLRRDRKRRVVFIKERLSSRRFPTIAGSRTRIVPRRIWPGFLEKRRR